MSQSHPDDEVLSALLDGDAGTDAQDHLDGCAACRERRDALDGVRRAVASPPPPPKAETAERAVGAALAAWSAERGTGATVTPLAHRRARRRPPGWVLGAAAGAAALLVAVPMLAGRGDKDSSQQTASAPAHGAAADEAAAGRSPLDGGDLGEQSDELALGELLRGAVSPPAGAASDVAAPAPATAGAERAAPPAPPTKTAAVRCTEVVRTTFGSGLGGLVYSASLRWQGTPAVLLAYRLADPSGPGPDHRAFVMAEDGCRLLVVQGF